jgi:hypothetical protein
LAISPALVPGFLLSTRRSRSVQLVDVTFVTSFAARQCNVSSGTQSEGRRLVMRHFPKRILIDLTVIVAAAIIIAAGAWFGFHGSSAHLLTILAR